MGFSCSIVDFKSEAQYKDKTTVQGPTRLQLLFSVSPLINDQ